jgi:hypothetical protein
MVSWTETMGRQKPSGHHRRNLNNYQELKAIQLVIDGDTQCAQSGTFRKLEDMRQIAVKVERDIGTQALRSMHCNFRPSNLGYKANLRHHTLT